MCCCVGRRDDPATPAPTSCWLLRERRPLAARSLSSSSAPSYTPMTALPLTPSSSSLPARRSGSSSARSGGTLGLMTASYATTRRRRPGGLAAASKFVHPHGPQPQSRTACRQSRQRHIGTSKAGGFSELRSSGTASRLRPAQTTEHGGRGQAGRRGAASAQVQQQCVVHPLFPSQTLPGTRAKVARTSSR